MSAPPTLTTARAEIRPLGPAQCLITTPTGASFTVDIDAATALRMVDAWSLGHPSPALVEGWDDAAGLLREVLERDGAGKAECGH